jgi:hypothetical protein
MQHFVREIMDLAIATDENSKYTLYETGMAKRNERPNSQHASSQELGQMMKDTTNQGCTQPKSSLTICGVRSKIFGVWSALPRYVALRSV